MMAWEISPVTKYAKARGSVAAVVLVPILPQVSRVAPLAHRAVKLIDRREWFWEYSGFTALSDIPVLLHERGREEELGTKE